ncbi:MAG: 4Fe-4S dicluster domain-containing protein [bacterium]
MKNIKMKRQDFRKLFIIISFLLFPIIQFYLSPYLPIIGLSQGIVAGALILFSLLFVSAFLVGRAPCGWIMPCAGMQEIFENFQKKPVTNKKANLVKWFIWIPWVLAMLVLVITNSINKIDPFFHTQNGISVYRPAMYFIYYGVILLVLVLSLTVGKRGFCHTACWMSPFMIIGIKIGRLIKTPSLKIVANKQLCIKCSICSKNCPMSLDVMNMVNSSKMYNAECILCMNCIDNCPKKVITWSW